MHRGCQVRAETQKAQRGFLQSRPPHPTLVILNLFQDNGSVTAYRADKRLHAVMLKQVQHDEVCGGTLISPHPVTAITALCSDFGVILEPAAAGCGEWGALGTDDGT